MNYYRQLQPAALDRAGVTRLVAEEVAFARRTADPFGLDDPCPANGGGPHLYIGSCGDVVCVHCPKVVWR